MMEMGEKLMDPLYQVFNYTIAESFLPIIGVIKKHIYNFKPVEDFFIQLTRKSIEQRQQSGITQLDYLDIVMKVKESTNCSDYESAGHAVQYFLDSFETTSISNAFVLYELGKDKRVQDKLRDEIKNCKDFSFDALDKLPYLEQVIYEALRLNPPLHLLSRLCTEPIELTIDNGKVVKIDVNEGVNIPIYYIHHDSEYYENPQTFYPERFDNGVKSFIDQGVLLPFSIGPRMCVGFRFGLVLMKYFFAYLLKDFEVILDTQTQPLEMDPRYFLNAPKNPIFVKFRKI